MAKSEEDFRASLELNAIRDGWSERFLLGGLFLEVVLLLLFSRDKSWCETASVIFANLLVFAGVSGEAYFGGKAKDAAKELDRLSQERVAEAERETEKLRLAASWRSLTENQHKGLALALKASGVGESVRFCVLLSDQESFTFASRISIPFAAAGWKVGFRFETHLHGIFTGICIPEPRDNWLDEMKEVNRRVREAFIAAEIPFVNGWPAQPQSYTDDAALITSPFAWVYVGPKPMPAL
jgi:hypothetical protein